MKKSKFFSLDWQDGVKAFIMAFIVAFVKALYDALHLRAFPRGWDQWEQIVIAGFLGAFGYLIKNVFENSNGEFGKPEPK